MTKHYLYVCPMCGLGSWTMTPLDEVYEPLSVDLFLHPEFGHIGNEILLCNCGIKLTWFSMTKLVKIEDD